MPNLCPLTPLQAFTAPLAIAQDHGFAISLEPDLSGVVLQIARSCSPERIRLTAVSPPADPAQLVAEINTHSGCEFVVAAARRRRAGHPPIAPSELRAILDGFTAHGFDEAPYRSGAGLFPQLCPETGGGSCGWGPAAISPGAWGPELRVRPRRPLRHAARWSGGILISSTTVESIARLRS